MNDQTNEPKLSKKQQKKLAAQEHNKKMQSSLAENRTPTLEERVELEALSKEVFNSTSRYLTLMNKGEVRLVMETVTEYIPDEKGGEGTTREVQVPVYINNNKKSVVLELKRHTVESVKSLMLERKAQQEKVRAYFAKIQADKVAEEANKRAEQEKAKLQKQIQDQVGGSAV